MRYSAVLLLLVSVPVVGQTLGAGIKGAFPVYGFETVSYLYRYGVRDSYIGGHQWGPALEVRVTKRWAVEADLLYGRERLQSFQAPAGAFPFPADRVNGRGPTLHLAVLAKWRLLRGPVTPFVSAGPAMRWTHLQLDLDRLEITPTDQVHTLSHADESHTVAGFAVGGGLEVRWGRLRIAPEVRYTAYGSMPCNACLSASGDFPNVSPVSVMVGIGF